MALRGLRVGKPAYWEQMLRGMILQSWVEP